MILLLNIDDIILTGNDDTLMHILVTSLSDEFESKQLGDLNYFLGIEVTRTKDTMVLTQKKYILELLTKADMLECKPANTPVVKESRASIHDGVLLENVVEYRTLVGSLQYLTMTRPDIAIGVNYVSWFMHAPTDVHFLLIKRILRYLKGIIGLGITLRKGDISSITTFTDSDWDGSLDTRRSTSGNAVFMCKSFISWSSKKQPTVSRSSAEAEYKCLLVTASDLFKELHVSVTYPITVYCDNTLAICLASNHVFHAREKHIEVWYHVVEIWSWKVLLKFNILPLNINWLIFSPKDSVFQHFLLQLPGTTVAAEDVEQCQSSTGAVADSVFSSPFIGLDFLNVVF
ncbi:uncharacterized protein LOC113273766 [Papaver somniferum]|uniref:uncharacterized protein LOC113273766 n=1 Tax=Papaver somniferum TaxID=3469 RepID=UPI000E6FA0BC|nr:uncharacterized protein LOC113273766 [Papaver somniferum]